MLQVEARAAVLSAAEGHAAPRAVPLHDALGLVLRAPDPLPPFRASIKVRSHGLPFLRSFASRTATDENRRPLFPFQDGYAIVASDGPGEYPVVTESRGRRRRPRRDRRSWHGRLRHHRRSGRLTPSL